MYVHVYVKRVAARYGGVVSSGKATRGKRSCKVLLVSVDRAWRLVFSAAASRRGIPWMNTIFHSTTLQLLSSLLQSPSASTKMAPFLLTRGVYEPQRLLLAESSSAEPLDDPFLESYLVRQWRR